MCIYICMNRCVKIDRRIHCMKEESNTCSLVLDLGHLCTYCQMLCLNWKFIEYWIILLLSFQVII